MLALTGLIFFQEINFTSLDLGRHLENGKIVWSEPQVLYKNLYSFTEPDHPFVNHHWLSGVVYYGLYKIGGFKILSLLNILLALLAAGFSFFHAKKMSGTAIAAIIGLPAIIIMSERTDIRPEMFSLFLIVLFFWLLEKWRQNESRGLSNKRIIYASSLIMLFWVNLHIYFFAGLLLISLFSALSLIFSFLKQKSRPRFKETVIANKDKIYLALGAWGACLANPRFIQGLIYPLNIFKAYGYEIVENKSPFFLENLMVDPNIFVFKLILGLLAASFIVKTAFIIRRKEKISERFIFHFFVSIFFSAISFFAIRNLPVFGLICWPIIALNFSSLKKWPGFAAGLSLKETDNKKSGGSLKINAITIAVILIVYASALNYVIKDEKTDQKIVRNPFGLGLKAGSDQSIKFFKENNLPGQPSRLAGPIFNNYDLGSALEFWLYPGERVFTDNRPEAYTVEFFQNIYKPMQTSKEAWEKYSKEYGINLIYFSYTDGTPWARQFLAERMKDENWPMIYFDNYTVLMVKNGEKNRELINRYKMDGEKFKKRFKQLAGLAGADKMLLANFAELYGEDGLAQEIYEGELAKNPQGGKQLAGLAGVYAGRPKAEDQIKAVELFKKAAENGYRLPGIYVQIGLSYWSLGEYGEAKKMWEEALKIDKENTHARYYLNQAGALIK